MGGDGDGMYSDDDDDEGDEEGDEEEDGSSADGSDAGSSGDDNDDEDNDIDDNQSGSEEGGDDEEEEDEDKADETTNNLLFTYKPVAGEDIYGRKTAVSTEVQKLFLTYILLCCVLTYNFLAQVDPNAPKKYVPPGKRKEMLSKIDEVCTLHYCLFSCLVSHDTTTTTTYYAHAEL